MTSSASGTEREILQVAFGNEACWLLTHGCHLQGLAATAPMSLGNSQEAPCSIIRTHTSTASSTSGSTRLYVPRVLLVDGDHRLGHPRFNPSLTSPISVDPQNVASSTWSGKVERLDVSYEHDLTALQSVESQKTSNVVATTQTIESYSSSQQYHAFDQFLQVGTNLSHCPYSRYQATPPLSQTPSISSRMPSSASNGRHVDWDEQDDEEEQEQEDENDEYQQYQRAQQEQRRRREFLQWQQATLEPQQAQLESFWTTGESLASVTTPETSAESPASPTSSPSLGSNLSWQETLQMAPYHPKSIYTLPMDTWDSDGMNSYYAASQHTPSTIEDSLEDRFRGLLEDCDACQGIVIASSGHGSFAGLSTRALQYFSDECASARRWLWSCHQHDQGDDTATEKATDTNTDSWRTRQVHKVRSHVEQGLVWHDHVELSHALLPVTLPSGSSMFDTTARTAAVLESATLGYRLVSSKNGSPRIGLNSYYYGSYSMGTPYGTASNLSFAEFLSTLTPSSPHKILELDALLPSNHQWGSALDNPSALWKYLQEGTSIERDHRMRDSRGAMSGIHRPREVLPGRWLQARPVDGSVLTSLSFAPIHADATGKTAQSLIDRSLHRHFALSTTVRPGSSSSTPFSSSDTMTCLMEGMGIRYRPEQSFACVLDQSLATVTDHGYAAGSYWGRVWGEAMPVVATLGNTTRVYPYLQQAVLDMNAALSSSRFRGFLNRDMVNGVLPESEDCRESISFCLNLRDEYRPPDGSGLADDGSDDDDIDI